MFLLVAAYWSCASGALALVTTCASGALALGLGLGLGALTLTLTLGVGYQSQPCCVVAYDRGACLHAACLLRTLPCLVACREDLRPKCLQQFGYKSSMAGPRPTAYPRPGRYLRLGC